MGQYSKSLRNKNSNINLLLLEYFIYSLNDLKKNHFI